MASYVCWGRGRGALDVMSQGHIMVEFRMESRRKKIRNINMNQEKKQWMLRVEDEIELELKGAVALISA